MDFRAGKAVNFVTVSLSTVAQCLVWTEFVVEPATDVVFCAQGIKVYLS